MEKDWPERLIAELCNALRERRLSLGLTIYQVSQSSGVSQQAISNYEKLNRRPTLDCFAKVALALDLKPSQLLALAEKRVGDPESRKKAAAKRSSKPKG